MLNAESNKTQRYLTMGHTMMLFCFAVCIFCGYTTAGKGGQVDSVTFNVNTDGSVTLRCETHFSGSDFEIDQRWVFQGRFLTKNTDIKAMIPSRYNVKYQKNGHDRVYTLTILNPVQADEGWYRCRIDYNWQGTSYLADKHVDVEVNAYLPSPNYPLCNIRPSQTLSDGNTSEFKCEVGSTTAQVTLKLTLRSDNGSVTHLGDVLGRSLHVIRTVTLRHNNSMFICEMTSETFPTVYRNCSAGPIIISASTTLKPPEKLTTEASQLPQNLTTELLTSTSQPRISSRKFATETYHSDPTSEINPSNTTKAKRNYSNRTARKMFILTLLGCAMGTLFLSLLIIICGAVYQRRTSKDVCTVTPPLKSVTKITNAKDNASFAKPRRYRKRYEPQPSTLARQPSSQDTRPNQIPLYAVVHQTYSEDENSLDTKAAKITETDIYEDIDLPAQDNSSESMSNTKTLGARAFATATGKNGDVKQSVHNQTTTSDDYEDVKLPVHSQTTASSEHDDVKLPVHNRRTLSDDYDDVKLPAHNQTTASDGFDNVELPVHSQTTVSDEYDDVKLQVHNHTPTPYECEEVKLPVLNEPSTLDEYDTVEIPVPNQTTIEEYEDDLPVPDELKGFSVDSLNTPQTEVMHYQDTNVTPGQSPFYVSVQPSNPSDEHMSDNCAHETPGHKTAGEYEDIVADANVCILTHNNRTNNIIHRPVL